MDSGKLRDYYGLLGVPATATGSEIHKAYWHRAYRCHPDMGGSHDEMVRLVEAWKILSDPEKRSRYDQLLKYRHDGWQSRKFNNDVLDARQRAEAHAAMSWAEFEEIYQKAFYAFNKDFYGEDIDVKAAGPYSPLLNPESKTGESKNRVKTSPSGKVVKSEYSRVFASITKIVILFTVIIAALFVYKNYSGIGRYVPLEQHGSSNTLILDTSNGTVYSVEKHDGALSTRLKAPFEHSPLKRND